MIHLDVSAYKCILVLSTLTCGGKNRNEGSEAGLSSEPTPRTTAWRTSVSVWEAGAGTSPLPSSHLVAVDGDLDRHIQGLVGHPTHCLQQGHENQGEPHEEDQSAHGDASNPVYFTAFFCCRPGGRGYFCRRRAAGQGQADTDSVGDRLVSDPPQSWGKVVNSGNV